MSRIGEHYEAFESDLLTKCGRSLEDVGRALSWRSLFSFERNLDLHSAYGREVEPELSAWSDTFKTNQILADIYDLLVVMNRNMARLRGTDIPESDDYPRPWRKQEEKDNKNTKKFGSDGMAPDELHKWLDERRRQYG